MRKVLTWSACVVVGLVALCAAFLLLVDVNQFRGTIQTQLETRLRRTVKLGDMSLKLFPLAVRVENVEIGESPEFASRMPFATAAEMQVHVGLGALLKRRIEVDSFRLRRPSVELIRNRGGKWNAATLGQEQSGGQGPPLTLAEFAIEDGRVAVTDHQGGKPRAVYDHIDIRVKDFAPGKRFSLEGSVLMPGQEKLALSIGGAGTLAEKTLTFDTLTAKLGGLTLAGRGEAKLGQDPAAISADLRADSIAVSELAKLAAAFGAGTGMSGSGALSLGAKIEGPANALSIAVSSTIREASLKTPAMEKPLEIKSADLRLKLAGAENGTGTLAAQSLAFKEFAFTDLKAACRIEGAVVRLDPVSARAFGGAQTGSITLDLRSKQPSYAVQMKMSQVDANQLLAATTPVRGAVFGTLSGDSDLRISVAPGQEMVRGLNGDVHLQLNNGKLAGVSLLNELASLAQLAGYAKKQESFTDFVKLTGTLHLVNGVANSDDLALEIGGGTIGATGQVGLPDQTLNLRVTAVLGKELSQQWTGGRLGGLMSTVLANKNGELVIPAIVTGTFSKPAFAPDAARVAKMKLDGLLPTKDGAKGMIGGVVGAITGKKDEKGQEKKPLRGLLDALRGK